jgi:hypothetical protein
LFKNIKIYFNRMHDSLLDVMSVTKH